MIRTMTENHQTQQRFLRGKWRTIGQLGELWGLSRARTRLVVDALVKSGRMEVRQRPAPEEHRRFYRAVA